MVIDDSVAATAANDMVQATAAPAPFTKTLPVYNAPDRAGRPVFRRILQPSRFNGRSTKGTGRHFASDGVGDNRHHGRVVNAGDAGCFVTAAVIPSVVMAATKTVTGTFRVGGTVTYTVTLTNSGNGVQG